MPSTPGTLPTHPGAVGPLPLERALADLAVPARDPRELGAPAPLLRALQDSRRALVVGHAQPPADGDAVGSCLGMRHVLHALGKDVDVCCDCELSGRLRALDGGHHVQRALALEGRRYDTVVVLDVAEAARVGGAAAWIAGAAQVLLVDHHHVSAPSAQSLGLTRGSTLHVWLDPEADATCLLVMRLVAALLDGHARGPEAWAQAAVPLLAGTLTDTGAFSYPGLHAVSLEMFKYVLGRHAGGDLERVRRAYAYTLPAPAAAVLEVLRPSVREGGAVGFLGVPCALVEDAVRAARSVDPQANRADVGEHLKWTQLPALSAAAGLAVMAVESPGSTHLEIRSRDAGPALELARSLGGGGHPRAAGATLAGGWEAAFHAVQAWTGWSG